jgi:pilus assembly protein Flp/PilA
MLEFKHLYIYARALYTKSRSEEGASAVEYGLLVAAIAALIVVIVFAFGHLIAGVFKGTCDTIQTNTPSAGTAC